MCSKCLQPGGKCKCLAEAPSGTFDSQPDSTIKVKPIVIFGKVGRAAGTASKAKLPTRLSSRSSGANRGGGLKGMQRRSKSRAGNTSRSQIPDPIRECPGCGTPPEEECRCPKDQGKVTYPDRGKSSPKIAHGMYRDRGKSSPKIAHRMRTDIGGHLIIESTGMYRDRGKSSPKIAHGKLSIMEENIAGRTNRDNLNER